MRTCIIVDGYRFSKDYIFYLSKKNIACIHVQSTASIISSLSASSTYDPADYIENFIYDNNFDALIDALQQFDPIAIMPAMESGVTLSDELNRVFGLKTNDYSLSKARRNKFKMIEALENATVPCMKYSNAKNWQDAILWIHQNTAFPVVIKPLESAGTDGVYICETEADLKINFKKIMRQNNCFGMSNESVLVQEFLRGTEYMINSVSCEGNHYFTDIWRCHKRYIKNHGMIYDREELIASDGFIQNQIKSYLERVLKAVGFHYGAAHAEIMWTEKGPILIEIGARVGGNVNCVAHTQFLGVNQLELNVDAYVDEPRYIRKAKYPYALLKNAMTILLSTDQNGIIESIPILEKIKSCQSLFWYRLNVKVGDVIHSTRDLFSSPGKIILIHEESDLIFQEYTMLMDAMKNAFIVNDEVL